MKKLSGVIIPAVTPLNEDYSLDKNGLRRLVEFLLAQRVHGIFANGSMGGFAFLPDEVQFKTIQAVAEAVAGRVPVLAGVSETSVERFTEKSRIVEQMEIDAMVVIAPYFYIMRQDEIKNFFLRIADVAKKPIVLYDNPRFTNNPLEVETIAELARHENVCGLKSSVPDVFKWQELLRADLPRERFALFAGAEKMMSLPLQLGFDGITGGLHNLVPNLAVELYETVKGGDFEKGDDIQRRINRAHRAFDVDGGWRGAETALRWMGICRKITAQMFEIPLGNEKREQILRVLTEEGILRPYPEITGEPSFESSGRTQNGSDGHHFALEQLAAAVSGENAVLNQVE